MATDGRNYDTERIEQLRLDAGLDKCELAKLADVTDRTIGNLYATGRARGRTIRAIAEVLGVEVRDLRVGRSEARAEARRTDR